MKSRRVYEFEGKTLIEVAKILHEGWNWHSPEIPAYWADEILEKYTNILNKTIEKAEEREWTKGWRNNFRYCYELVLHVDGKTIDLYASW